MSFFDFFFDPYQARAPYLIILEAIAFVFGILSVYLAKKEHIGVYPTGIVATVITMYLFYVDRLLGDMLMNAYYSIMSLYGWYEWSRITGNVKVRQISHITRKERKIALFLIALTMSITYTVYRVTKTTIAPSNWVDILSSGMFFTAMWLMALKKIENWTLWIIANCISIPLYAYRGWGMLSLQYIIFTILAFQGYSQWKKSLGS
ncbi:MAG: nicotinamide riboside transporter PnuC [Bacteroidetes bacterium]|nr:nicotinamide riboside transporter PnuC [Bacteroidota bacterium]